MPTTDELLDLVPSVGQRFEGWRFDVLDEDHGLLFSIPVDKDSPPTVQVDVDSKVRRQLTSLHITADVAPLVDPVRHRIRPVFLLSNGYERAKGVFLFSDPEEHVESWGSDLTVTLVDQTMLVDQPASTTFSLTPGALFSDAMIATLDEAGIPAERIDVEPSTRAVSDPVSWKVGTSRWTRLEDLCRRAGYFSPYFDDDGVGKCRSIPTATAVDADHVYDLDEGSRVLAGSVQRGSTALASPNVWQVVSIAPGDVAIVGEYRLPDVHPLSAANRGERVRSTNVQGIADLEAVNAAAKASYEAEPAPLQWVEFDSAIDPRHDVHASVSFDGEFHVERKWSIVCRAGGPMHHMIRREYADD